MPLLNQSVNQTLAYTQLFDGKEGELIQYPAIIAAYPDQSPATVARLNKKLADLAYQTGLIPTVQFYDQAVNPVFPIID